MNPQTVLAIAPLVIRVLTFVIPVLVGLLLIPMIAVSAILNKSTVAWPVSTPREVGVGPEYLATGWSVTSPYGWRSDIADPSQYEFHDGIDLDGAMFCDGCRVPTMGDVEIVGIGWDDPRAADPMHAGAGVVVDMMLQHPQEAGTIRSRGGRRYDAATPAGSRNDPHPVWASETVPGICPHPELPRNGVMPNQNPGRYRRCDRHLCGAGR